MDPEVLVGKVKAERKTCLAEKNMNQKRGISHMQNESMNIMGISTSSDRRACHMLLPLQRPIGIAPRLEVLNQPLYGHIMIRYCYQI